MTFAEGKTFATLACLRKNLRVQKSSHANGLSFSVNVIFI